MIFYSTQSAARSQQTGGDEGGFRIRMDGGSSAAGRARSEIARLGGDLDSPLLENMRLLVTELVSNSVRHAGASTVELTVAVRPADVHVEVSNSGEPFTPTPRERRQEADSGWGLYLLDCLSDDWGVFEDSGRQRVWFELARA